MRVMEADKVEVEQGDMVCLHTGFAEMIMELQEEPDARSCCTTTCTGLDGRDEKLLQWVIGRGSPCSPPTTTRSSCSRRRLEGRGHAMLPLHEHCLFKLGIHLGEIWYLTRARRLAARAQAQPLPAHRAAAAAARRGRLARPRRWPQSRIMQTAKKSASPSSPDPPSGIGAATAVELAKRGWSVWSIIEKRGKARSKCKRRLARSACWCRPTSARTPSAASWPRPRWTSGAASTRWSTTRAPPSSSSIPTWTACRPTISCASTGSTWSGRSRWCAPARRR